MLSKIGFRKFSVGKLKAQERATPAPQPVRIIMSEDLILTPKTQPESETKVEKTIDLSLDVLPQELIGRYGSEGQVIVHFRSLEERKFYHLGKLLSVNFYDQGNNNWDSLYQQAKEKGKLLVVHASFNPFTIEEMKGLKSTSIISPGNDTVAHYAGYVYELDVNKVLALFASDSEVRTRFYERCVESKTRDGRNIYHREHPQINIGDLPNLVDPHRQQSPTDAIVDFDDIGKQKIKPVAIFNRIPNHQEWKEEAKSRGIDYIPSTPYLDHSAIEEIERYTETLAQSITKTPAEIKTIAMKTYEDIQKKISRKSGDVRIEEP